MVIAVINADNLDVVIEKQLVTVIISNGPVLSNAVFNYYYNTIGKFTTI